MNFEQYPYDKYSDNESLRGLMLRILDTCYNKDNKDHSEYIRGPNIDSNGDLNNGVDDEIVKFVKCVLYNKNGIEMYRKGECPDIPSAASTNGTDANDETDDETYGGKRAKKRSRKTRKTKRSKK